MLFPIKRQSSWRVSNFPQGNPPKSPACLLPLTRMWSPNLKSPPPLCSSAFHPQPHKSPIFSHICHINNQQPNPFNTLLLKAIKTTHRLTHLLHSHLPLQQCTVATTSLIIHAPPPSSDPQERYVFSTAAFPRIPPSETLTPFAPPSDPLPPTITTTTTTTAVPVTDPLRPASPTARNEAEVKRFRPPPVSNLPEQFRGTLSRLTTSLTRLAPLPENCSFTVAIELREEAGVEAPIGREEDKRWIVAEPGWQRDGGGSGGGEEGGADVGNGSWGSAGKYLGGVRTTPVRKVEAGAFAMECWVEEGREKFRAGVEDEDEDI